ncbi:hypothetical protein [Phenylobacterium sp.]|uniref:hypothetical protein n=1 Tax=Phenylobacterium sp. TaxID=1871053 RepID=UPI003BACB23E
MCLWLDSEKLDAAWRPDRARFLMYTEKDGRRLNVIVDPASPMAWKREPYYSRIKAMSRRVLEGFELVVCIDTRRIVVFPHEDVDLGHVNPDHKIVSSYAERDGQSWPYAMVLSDVGEPRWPRAETRGYAGAMTPNFFPSARQPHSGPPRRLARSGRPQNTRTP